MTGAGRPTWGPRGGLTTVGTGRVRVVPDLAVVELAAQAVEADPAAALATASAAVRTLVASLASAGVAGSDVRTCATSTWTDPGSTVHEPDGDHVRPPRTTVRIAVEARLEAAGSGEVLASVLEAAQGAATLDRTSFEISDDAPARRRARELAFEDASAAARQLAELAGRPLGQVLDVREEPDAVQGSGPVAFAARAATVPIEAGDREVVVRVQLRHAWGDLHARAAETDDDGTPKDR